MRPFSPSASAHWLIGTRQRRWTKLSRQNGVVSLSSRALVTGLGFNGWPCLPFITSGKPQIMARARPSAITSPG